MVSESLVPAQTNIQYVRIICRFQDNSAYPSSNQNLSSTVPFPNVTSNTWIRPSSNTPMFGHGISLQCHPLPFSHASLYDKNHHITKFYLQSVTLCITTVYSFLFKRHVILLVQLSWINFDLYQLQIRNCVCVKIMNEVYANDFSNFCCHTSELKAMAL